MDRFLLLALIGLLVFVYCKNRMSIGLSSTFGLASMLIVYRVLYSTKLGFEGMFNFKLFSASAYASSAWIPSLGDLLLNGILFFLLTIIFLQKGEIFLSAIKIYPGCMVVSFFLLIALYSIIFLRFSMILTFHSILTI